MPENGLPDCKQLLSLLQSQPFERPLSENAKKLKTIVKEALDKIEKLEAFDAKEVVNLHCDQLENEVKEAAASAIEHVRKIEQELLNEIELYRNKCLSLADDIVKQELKALSVELKQFDAKWNRYFTNVEELVSDADIRASLDQINSWLVIIQRLENQWRYEALDRKLTAFTPNLAFFQTSNSLGQIEDLSRRKSRIADTPTWTAVDSSGIYRMIYLSDNRLAICSEDETIRVWNLQEGSELFKLAGLTQTADLLALLPNDYLVSGSYDSTIKIWDLDERKEIRTLCGHTDSVLSLCVLKNGNLASSSLDETIRIWNPHLNENNLLLTISGHENFSLYLFMGVFSNGSLVSLSRDKDDTKEKCIIRIWNPEDGKLIKEISNGLIADCTSIVLRDYRVAFGNAVGSIIVIDLKNDDNSVTKEKAHDSSVTALVLLSNENLVSCGLDGSKWTIKVWNLSDFDLVQTVETGHFHHVLRLGVSPAETCLTSADVSGSFKLWAISN